ncbi:unnamed protein product [Enterobius vermicularis]|uniref:PE domain-containing protein n=1 Tax=Enterobius vermicularis TaxID=51028 RepID=A0A0N4VA00_ENTVE|nr:unnamed protein product [Enterobius vermicularis]
MRDNEVTDVDLRDQLNVNAAAAEAVHAATDVFQQGIANSAYVNASDGLSPGNTEFVGLGAETVHIGTEDSEHQQVTTMDVYPLGHHINAP